MKEVMEPRLSRLRQRMADDGLAALVVLGEANCRYLTGFTGEASSVCVTADELILFTDPRFTLQAQEQAPQARLVVCEGSQDERVPEVLAEFVRAGEALKPVVGMDLAFLTVRRWEHLRPLLEEAGFEWRLVTDLVESCRQVKFPDELEALRKSGALVSQAFAYLEGISVVGRTELDVTLDLEMYLRKSGSEGVAFPFIVAAGARGAMPHAEPSDNVIREGQLLILDIGTVVDGYASDITRTYSTGGVEGDLLTAYNAVVHAQEAAVAAARAGLSCRELDSVARDILAAADLAELFVHSLGHGVGLEVHEAPTVSQRSESILEAGMVVTIEPGVYVPGRGGIRIEDTVIIHPDGAEIITPWPKELRYVH